MVSTAIGRRLAGVTAIVVAAVAVVLVMRGADVGDAGCGQAFDVRKWKLPESRLETRLLRGSVRLEMAEELVRCRTLDRMTRPEVRILLGKPEYPGWRDSGGPCYDLGAQPELGGLDNRVLCLTFDRSRRLKRASVGTS